LAACAAAGAFVSGDERLAVSGTGAPGVSGAGFGDGFGAPAVVLWKAEKSGKITSLCNF
jgi:hypothetical protein